jgi:hypothetical protein
MPTLEKQKYTVETQQDIADIVIPHMVKQNCKSTPTPHSSSWTSCMYRGHNNTMCAVGCLIKEQFYNKKLEGSNVMSFEVIKALKSSGVCTSQFNMDLLKDFQRIHDSIHPDFWKQQFELVIQKYNLKMPKFD